MLLALVVTQLLARGMTSPLRQMTQAAQQMATGDYTRRVTASSNDEVGELARAFNTMAADLDAVDRQRRDLVANVAQMSYCWCPAPPVPCSRTSSTAKADQATLQGALDQTERLSDLVTDLLDLSRVDAGIVALRREPVALQGFLDETVAEARLTGRPVEYVVLVPPDLTVHGDRPRLHQLVANLLDNERHSRQASATVVGGEPVRTVLEVNDEGAGIAPFGPRPGLRAVHHRRCRRGRWLRPRPGAHRAGSPSCTAASSRWPSPTSPDAAAASARRSPKGTRHDQPLSRSPRRLPRSPFLDDLFGAFWPGQRSAGRRDQHAVLSEGRRVKDSRDLLLRISAFQAARAPVNARAAVVAQVGRDVRQARRRLSELQVIAPTPGTRSRWTLVPGAGSPPRGVGGGKGRAHHGEDPSAPATN